MTIPIGDRTSTGLDPRLAGALAYLGGFISGLVLLAVEKESRFVRFHAMQSTAFFLAVLVASIAVNSIFFLGAILYAFVLFPAVVILWLVLMFKAYRGDAFKLPFFGDFSEKHI